MSASNDATVGIGRQNGEAGGIGLLEVVAKLVPYSDDDWKLWQRLSARSEFAAEVISTLAKALPQDSMAGRMARYQASLLAA